MSHKVLIGSLGFSNLGFNVNKCVYLMLLRVALHDGAACPHLSHDAASAPQVNGWPVIPLPQQELRWSVPERDHSVGVPVQLVTVGEESNLLSPVVT